MTIILFLCHKFTLIIFITLSFTFLLHFIFSNNIKCFVLL